MQSLELVANIEIVEALRPWLKVSGYPTGNMTRRSILLHLQSFYFIYLEAVGSIFIRNNSYKKVPIQFPIIPPSTQVSN